MGDLDRRFSEYSRRVAAYEATWWRTDQLALKRMLESSSLRDQLEQLAFGRSVTTEDVYRDARRWTSTRAAAHAEWVDSLAPHATTSDHPTVVFLLGLPGSGKTRTVRPLAQRILDRVDGKRPGVRDADELRVMIPEYATGLGSGVVQDEAAFVTYGELSEALGVSGHLIVDSVGNPRYLPREVEHFAARGMSVYILCTSVSLDVAIERAKRRAIQDGRYVPIGYLKSCAGRPEQALASVRDSPSVNGWALIDTARLEAIEASDSLEWLKVGPQPVISETGLPS